MTCLNVCASPSNLNTNSRRASSDQNACLQLAADASESRRRQNLGVGYGFLVHVVVLRETADVRVRQGGGGVPVEVDSDDAHSLASAKTYSTSSGGTRPWTLCILLLARYIMHDIARWVAVHGATCSSSVLATLGTTAVGLSMLARRDTSTDATQCDRRAC